MYKRISYLFFCLICALPSTGFSQESSQPVEPGYTLLPGDILEIAVWQEPELQREVLVRPDGRISFFLVGDVLAVGRTVPSLRASLEDALERYIPEAVVSVSVSSIDGNRIYVIGQVQDPGSFVVNPRVDVIQALSLAGGMTPFAAVNDVIILRREDGVQKSLGFRYGEVEKGRNLEQNIELKPGDIVIVP